MKRIDDKYEVTRELGHGGMGSVYEGRHERTSRRVAIKVIKEALALDPQVVERFQREARAAGSIESDHITDVLDCGVDRESGAPYLVMELLAGEDLDAALKRIGPLRPEVAARVAAQMLVGLEKAHDAGVVHRDIKPANVFLAKKEGTAIVAKIGDFGVAKVKPNPLESSENALTQTSALLGSPPYMSPEQVKGAKDIDARTDLWSTGVVLYECLAGATPYAHADTLGLLLLAICSEEAPPIQSKAPWVPPELAAIVTRALDPDIARRFQSAGEMLREVVATLPDGTSLDGSMFVALTEEERAHAALALPGAIGLASTATGVAKASEPPPAEPARPRRRAGAIAIGAAVALGVGATALSIFAPHAGSPKAQGLVSASTSVVESAPLPPPLASSVSLALSAEPATVVDAGRAMPAVVAPKPPPLAHPPKPSAAPAVSPPPPAASPSGPIRREWRP